MKRQIKIIVSVFFAVLVLMSGCKTITTVNNPSVSEHGNINPPKLQPGLSVIYIFKKYRNIDQIPVGDAALGMGRAGLPVTIIDHKSGKNEQVFTSGRSQGVAMILDGFLKLKKPGVYHWQALANDGVRMFINNVMIFEDPGVHGDRLTPKGTLHISRSGMYPVRIIYFQRKGTAALKLFWQPPDTDQFSLVPARVYMHQPLPQ